MHLGIFIEFLYAKNRDFSKSRLLTIQGKIVINEITVFITSQEITINSYQ
jgi:hypothetical protein